MRRLLTPRWILVHAAAIALVTAFLLLGWWQVGRATQGNLLSFGYAIEWPAFAAFVIYVWVKEMRQTLRGKQPPPVPPSQPLASRPVAGQPLTSQPLAGRPGRNNRLTAAYDDTDDEELAAYNRYLAWLNANPHASPSDYPSQTR